LRTYAWLFVGYPLLVVTHSVVCLISWLLVFTIPVAKMSGKTLHTILLMPPEHIHINHATAVRALYYDYEIH